MFIDPVAWVVALRQEGHVKLAGLPISRAHDPPDGGADAARFSSINMRLLTEGGTGLSRLDSLRYGLLLP